MSAGATVDPHAPAPPALHYMGRLALAVAPVVTLGTAPGQGERRYVALGSGRAEGPELCGEVLEGGVDWQWQRDASCTDISAHYVLRLEDGALVEVRSEGLRHGAPEVMARLARGERVPPEAYFFRTLLRFHTGHADWLHLNRVLALGCGQREAARVLLEVWRLG